MKRFNLSLEEAAAQCVFPRLNIDKYFEDIDYKNSIIHLVSRGVGGFCIFGGNKQIAGKAVFSLQEQSALPLLFCADFEYGLPMRLNDGVSYPQAMALGRTDTETVYQTAKKIAAEAKSIGIMWMLAPVCDINSNPDNPIINTRSFGENVELVSDLSSAFIKGTQDEGLMACAKHFPGHGDTETDSHIAMPILNQSLKQLSELELIPFKNAIAADVASVMLGHLGVNAFDSENMPASLSENTINYLRNELKFDGLIVSDALDMKAVSNIYPPSEIAIKAISAGNNIALMPDTPETAIDSLIDFANNNTNLQKKLFASSELILQKKKWLGLFNRRIPAASEVQFDEYENEQFAFHTALRAVEIIDPKSILPIKDHWQIAAFAVLQDEDIEPASFFFKLFAQALENDVDFGFLDSNVSDDDIQALKSGIVNADIVVFALFYRAKAYSGKIDIDDKINVIINKLSLGKKSIAVLLGNPYSIKAISTDAYIRTFSASIPSIAASVHKLAGRDTPLSNI